MTIYKVRRGEEVTDVDGFAALVQMAQEGRLGPDDAVFVPASNRWHYARSIRQLREHFAIVEDPPPPTGKVREMTREMREATNPGQDPTEATNVQDGNGAGGNVVPMRRGRWTAEGKGVDVPVFSYDVDADAKPVPKPLRWAAIVGFALTIGGAYYVYSVGYAKYLDRAADQVEQGAPPPTPPPTPVARRTNGSAAGSVATAPAATVQSAMPTATATVHVALAPTPVPLPAFDSDGARNKVMNAGLGSVTRADQLAPAMKSDLIKLAVPVRAVQLIAGKAPPKSKAKGPFPFELVIDYALGDDNTRATHAKHYWMIAAMAGRRATELHLNLRAVTIRSFKSGAKPVSVVELPPDMVKGVAAGSTSTETVLPKFSELTKP